jgi:hypothetical protein
MAKLTIAEVQNKTTKGGKPYLNVKSTNGNWFYVWSDVQAIWHFFVVGQTLEVATSTQGKFTSITGVVGGENAPQVKILNEPLNGIPVLWEKLFARLDRMEAKIDAKAANYGLTEKLPSLNDLPVHNLEDKEIKPEDLIPF